MLSRPCGALVSLYRTPPPQPYRPIYCRCSPFWVVTDSSCLTGLSGTLAFCITRRPGDRSERRPLSSSYISSNMHFNLRDIKRLSWTYTLVLRFAFRLGKRYLFWTCQPRLSRADSHNPTFLRAAYHSWRRARIPSRNLPASATWSRSPWCPPRGTIHFGHL